MRDHSLEQARDLLGVDAHSDPETLTHAYRRLARANHPDVSAEPDAPQRFRTITAAYRLLRDHAALDSSQPPMSKPGVQPPLRSAPEPSRGLLARTPIVAGPVVVTPIRAGTCHRGDKGGV